MERGVAWATVVGVGNRGEGWIGEDRDWISENQLSQELGMSQG